MEVRYYELDYDDIKQISDMETRYFSSPWSEASIGHYAEAGNTIFIVARSDEDCDDDAVNIAPKSGGKDKDYIPKKVVGYAAVLCAADEGNLVSIAVDEDCREMGIASELLDISYDMALQRGVTSINLEVRESNIPAISLYEKEGFKKVGKRPAFYRNPEEDALLYIKEL